MSFVLFAPRQVFLEFVEAILRLAHKRHPMIQPLAGRLQLLVRGPPRDWDRGHPPGTVLGAQEIIVIVNPIVGICPGPR
jgi:hypothetical protein